MKTCIHYSNRKLLRMLASYKVCLCLLLCVRAILYGMVVNFYGDEIFMDFVQAFCNFFQVHFMLVYRSLECLRNTSVALRSISGPNLLFGSLYGDHCLSSDFTSDMHCVM